FYCKLLDINSNNLEKYDITPQDDHGENYKSVNDKFNQITTHKENDFVKSKIKFKTDSNDNIIITNSLEKLKQLDAVLNNILVLDERIQEKADTLYSLKGNLCRPVITYREVWQNVGCFIPWKNEVDLSSSEFKGTQDKIKNWIQSLREGNLRIQKDKNPSKEVVRNRTYSKIDTLIIHIGVIEKCLEAEKREKNCIKEKEAFIKSILGNDDFENVNVILTSGRAPKKENLISNCSFLSISTITDYLINNRFKYSLNELCNLARPKI
ncbi:MAG: hypothetical protein KDC67_15530, partial [Ignavibacteriae bacterium]|nr:hypothetical protein [Ignavibacteriota bacterium]